MLYLLFELGKDRYALDVRQIVEVLPQVDYKRLLGAMPGITGLFNYRGTATPLIDLTQLSLGHSCPTKMSTRIIVSTYGAATGGKNLIGLLAERVTETVRLTESDFENVAGGGFGSNFTGPMLVEGNLMVQRVEIRDLMSRDLELQLFAEATDRGP